MISIVMPTYNRAVYLVDSLNSILQQSYKDWECIVVDDGSTDSTPKLMDYYTKKDKRIKYHPLEKNEGIAYARNQGILISQGTLVAVADSDDVFLKDRLRRSLKAMTEGVDVVYTSYYLGDERAKAQSIYAPPAKPTKEDFKGNGAVPHVTILAKRECFERHPYRPEFRVNDDAALLADWYNAGYVFKRVREPLTIVRIHAGNVSTERAKEIEKTQAIVDKMYN